MLEKGEGEVDSSFALRGVLFTVLSSMVCLFFGFLVFLFLVPDLLGSGIVFTHAIPSMQVEVKGWKVKGWKVWLVISLAEQFEKNV